jgi:hypothetical protein
MGAGYETRADYTRDPTTVRRPWRWALVGILNGLGLWASWRRRFARRDLAARTTARGLVMPARRGSGPKLPKKPSIKAARDDAVKKARQLARGKKPQK